MLGFVRHHAGIGFNLQQSGTRLLPMKDHVARSPSRHVPDPGTAPHTWYHAESKRPLGIPIVAHDTHRADVVVIGAGFTGVSAALDLAQAGLSVIVLEAGLVGAGASGRNGGLICSGWRQDQPWLESRLGADAAAKLWALSEDAKADLLARTKALGIDVHHESGLINVAHAPSMMDWLDEDAEVLASRYGYRQLARLDRQACAEALGTDVYFGGWHDGGAGRIQPLRLLYGLAQAAVEAGAILFEGSTVTGIGAKKDGRHVVNTDGGAEVHAAHVLVCGDAYLDGVCPPLEARVMPIGSFVVATEPLDPQLGILKGASGAMDTRFVVNYFQRTRDNRLVFGGGEKYTPAWPADIAGFVRGNLEKVYPSLKGVRIDHAWAGAVGITPTRLPWLRQIEQGVLVAGGYSGQGVALAPYFGRLLARAVIHQASVWDILNVLPVPQFPGGRLMRWPLLTAALNWYALRDRLA